MAESNISKQVRLNEILITFIIPCYNSQETISRCLESILVNQSKNIEIICVDDFSTDKTAEIIDSHMNQDKRIQYFKKSKHTNAGDTRNIGIKMASGVYCWFVDSDDFVSTRSIDILIGIIKKYSFPDLVISNYITTTSHKYEVFFKHVRQVEQSELIEIKNRNLDNYYQLTYPAVWNKLFKLELIQKNRIYFQSIESCNDVFFTRAYMSIVKNILHVNKYTYHYHTNYEQSITASRGKRLLNIYRANYKVRRFLKKKDMYMKLKKTFYASFISNIRYESMHCDKKIFKLFHYFFIYYYKTKSKIFL